MSRNDSVLYTGATSASFSSPRAEELKAKRELKQQQRRDSQQRLKPSAEVINAILDQEKVLITKELANLPLNVSTTEENVKELLMTFQRNLQFIDRVKTKVNLALRESKSDLPEELEDE